MTEKKKIQVSSSVFVCAGGLLSTLVGLSACSAIPSAAAPPPDHHAISETETSSSRATVANYPVAMRGIWMPEEVGCSSPLNYDSEILLSVGADMLGQYENTTKPLRVDPIGERPPTWRILSTFSPGSGEYEGSENITYSVDGDTMIIDNGKAKSVFTRCK